MTGNLPALREAISLASDDLAKCLAEMRVIIAETQHVETLTLFAKIEGNTHELELLRKRELDLVTHGREEQP
ncbi:hypothetical protein [Prosthecobacter sp.]|jgi:hypothetical protein|uniref:hypothetical protein n=1 Tax=Prosthecobacter sp. TaxID=1965333 RepID=UPI0037C8BF82